MISTLPTVSIITLINNQDPYHHFENSLDLLLNQNYPYLEIVLIHPNLYLQEKTETWLNKQKNKIKDTFRFVHLIEDELPHIIINKGIAASSGNFISLLTSKDIYYAQRIEKLVDFIQQEKAEIAFTIITAMDKEGSPLPFGHSWRNSYEMGLTNLKNTPTVGFQLLEDNLPVSTGNLFFSRNIWQRLGGFRELAFEYAYDFIIRSLLITEPVFLDEELLYYRIEDNDPSKETEINEIYQNFLVQSSRSPPENRQAPCHWYWPQNFILTRERLKMDKSLSKYLIKAPKIKEIESSIKKTLISPPQLSSKKEKICLVTHDLSLTGSPKLVVDLAQALKQEGYKVKVISFLDGPMRKELEDFKIPLSIVPPIITKKFSSKKSFLTKCCNILFAAFYLRLKLSDITIFNSASVGRFLVPVSFFNLSKRLIWYLHDSFPLSSFMGFKYLEDKEKEMFWLRKIVVSATKYVLKKHRFDVWFGSNSTNEILKKSNLNGKTIYWSGIPHSGMHEKTNKKSITEILSVGTSSPRKGTHNLIDAFIMGVNEKLINEDVRLTIIGFEEKNVNSPYPYVGDLVLKIIHSGLKERIRLVANLQPKELEDYYHQADLYVHSSIAECLPLALLKAMSLGLPIITTNANGCIEAIENNKTGYVCPLRNNLLLLETIILALKNPAKSKAMGKEAKKVFNEKFSLEKNVEGVLQALNFKSE